MRRFLDARVERAAGRARDTVLLVNRFVVFPKGTWRVVLALRTPPLRAAAKRRRGSAVGYGMGVSGAACGARASDS